LREKADDFLRTYNPSGEIPVPIEEIVEFKFGINIVPVLGLQRQLEVEGFTSSDLKSIYVDEYVYTEYLNRYRFTLAHEIGHVVLHRHLYGEHKFKTIEGWKVFINSMDEDKHRWLEYQGYSFAGLILVPRENLIKHTGEWIKKIKKIGISLAVNWDFSWDLITEHLGEEFQVSSSVIEKRIEKDGIKKKYIQ
jgi:hypothetical protein